MRQKYTTPFHIALWAGCILLVLAMGIRYFPAEDPGLDFWGAFYYSIRLFILEHDLSHFPTTPQLVFLYFFAPLVAISALGTALTYFFRISPALRCRMLKDHVVICGMGRTGKLLAATLRQKGVKVVGVDKEAPEQFEEWCGEHKIPIIFGSFQSRKVLERAGASRARTLIFASGDDLANLEGVVGAYDALRCYSGPPRLLWAHIANERLADTARRALQTEGSYSIRFFDTYRISASRMIARHFNHGIRDGVSEITILGFGKFGRDLMEVLVRDAGPSEHWSIRVVDIRDVENEVRFLAAELGIADHVSFTRSAVQDLDLADSAERAFFLCTDDDIGNLAAALMLAGKSICTYIYVRMATWPMPAIADHLGQNHGLTFININDLVVQGIDDLPGIFSPAGPDDLKRRRTGSEKPKRNHSDEPQKS